MSANHIPENTRLRFVISNTPEGLQKFIDGLGVRVQIYSIVKDGDGWACWFVPPDNLGIDIKSKRIKL